MTLESLRFYRLEITLIWLGLCYLVSKIVFMGIFVCLNWKLIRVCFILDCNLKKSSIINRPLDIFLFSCLFILNTVILPEFIVTSHFPLTVYKQLKILTALNLIYPLELCLYEVLSLIVRTQWIFAALVISKSLTWIKIKTWFYLVLRMAFFRWRRWMPIDQTMTKLLLMLRLVFTLVQHTSFGFG